MKNIQSEENDLPSIFLDGIITFGKRCQSLTSKILSQFGNQKLLLGFIIGICLFSISPPNITGQGTLSLSVNRNVGMAFGNYISGTFTLTGSGPAAVQNMTVYFNEDEVHFVDGNSISWQFNTGNFLGGGTNITLVGIDDVGELYTASRHYVFIPAYTSTIITIGIIALVSVLIIAKYGSRFFTLRKK